MDCMRNINASILSAKQFEITHVNTFLMMPFVPTSDFNKSVTSDPSRFNLKPNPQIQHEVLAGTNQNEGTFFDSTEANISTRQNFKRKKLPTTTRLRGIF